MTTVRSDRLGPRRRSRALAVQDGVKDLILGRRLAAGDPLPTECELAEELRVGRNAVREALKALQAVGIVDIRHGFGMFVGRMSLHGLVDELTFHGRLTLSHERSPLTHISELREALETGLLHLLIDRRPAPDPALTGLLERMEAEAGAGSIAPETERDFHHQLYRPLDNPVVGQLLGAFWDVYHQLHDAPKAPGEDPHLVARIHRDLHDAVLTADRAAATAAIRAHFGGRPGPTGA